MCPTSNSAETTSGADSRTLPGMQIQPIACTIFEFSIILNFYQSINQSFWRFKVDVYWTYGSLELISISRAIQIYQAA